MAEHYNPGFAFYDTYYKAIENLPVEQQKEICYAYVKYGITYEMVDPNEMPLGYAFVMNNKQNIKNSVDRWLVNQSKANQKIDSVMGRDRAIAQLIAQGMKSKEIAEEISKAYNIVISDSAIRKTNPWKERDDEDFCEKWLGEKCENSQNFPKISRKNSCEQNVTERENSQKFTNLEQNASQSKWATEDFPYDL